MSPTPPPDADRAGSPLAHLPHLAEHPGMQRSASSNSHRSTASARRRAHHAHTYSQQANYVPSGNPLVPRLGTGLAEREIQFDGEREAEESAFSAIAGDNENDNNGGGDSGLKVQHIEYSPSPSRSRRTKRDGNSASPSRSRSRPVGASRPVRRYESDSGSESEFSDEENHARTASEDWDNVRDGSISRRPAWRRPSPRWVLPFVLGATLSLGMTLTVRAELYLDLACLVHPPRMPSESNGSVAALAVPSTAASALDFTPFWPHDFEAHANANFSAAGFIAAPVPDSPETEPLTPSERWFLDAQKDIWDYITSRDKNDDSNKKKHEKGSPLPLPSDPAPGSPPDKKKKKNPSTPFPEIDPAQCKRDAGVQQAAAKLSQILTVVGGILSAITTGWWARYSDHSGRRKVLAVTEIGLLVNDACFLIIASYPRLVIQTELWILLAGPAIDGLLGGFSTITATMHAYISDVTPDGSRATAFSRLGAALMAGLAVGPVLGTLLISATGNLLTPFYVSVTVHFVFTILLRFVLPESLSSDSRAMLAKRAKAASQAKKDRDVAERAWEADGDEETPVRGDSGFSRIATPIRGSRVGRRAVGEVRRMARRAVTPLQPLAVFIPQKLPGGGRNYNLLLLAIVNFIIAQMMGVVAVKAQYTFWAFGWSPSQLGPYLSFISVCRLVVLLGILPLAMRRIKPYFQERTIVEAESGDAGEWRAAGSEPASERTPLLSAPAGSSSPASPTSPTSPTTPATDPAAPKAKPKRSAKLDIWVMRTCLFAEFLAYCALGLNASGSQGLFIAASMLTTLGSPGLPACNSLALSFLPHKRDAGRLFGGLAVLHAVGASLIAPIVFFSIFSATVSTYAPTVFLVAAGMITVAQGFMLFVRVPKVEEEGRGRGRGAKRIRSASRLRREREGRSEA